MRSYTIHPVRYKNRYAVTLVLVAVTTFVSVCYWMGYEIPGYEYLGPVSVSAIEAGQWWVVLTSMLLHGDIVHLANNMLSLWYLGRLCESAYGRIRYVELYLFGGIFASLCYVCVRLALGDGTGAVGASGAIFSLFGAYGSILYRLRMRRDTQWVSVNGQVSGWWRMLLWNIFYGFVNPGIANEAHIGGLVFGFVCGMLLNKQLIENWRKPKKASA